MYVIDLSFLLILTESKFLGYDDAAKIAKQDGFPLVDDDDLITSTESQAEELDNLNEIAGKLVRFFTHSEENKFALFVECGIERVIQAVPTPDHDSIQLTIKIPLPPDDLFHYNGFKHATKISLNETDETFLIPSPRRLSTKHKKVNYYPNNKVPIWVVFMYEFEEDSEDELQEVKVNLMNSLTGL